MRIMYNEYTPERVTKLKAIEGNVSIKRTKQVIITNYLYYICIENTNQSINTKLMSTK